MRTEGLEGVADHELAAFMRRFEQDLRAEYERVATRATEDAGTAGDEGEENWADFLRAWLPEGYHVTTKGRIVGTDGSASAQMDVVVLHPSYPPFLRTKKHYLAGGVAAAFECKTTLKKAHLREAVDTAAELHRVVLPSLKTRRGTPYRELHSPIIYGLLAHSHSWSDETAADHVGGELQQAMEDSEHPQHLLDVVCVSNLAAWVAGHFSYTGPHAQFWRNDEVLQEHPDGYATTISLGPPDEKNWPPEYEQRDDVFPIIPLGQLTSYLTKRLAWEDPSLRSMAEYYRGAGLYGSGQGPKRTWPLEDVYSPGVVDELKQGRADDEPWSEWGLKFL